jgi:hypothetical protein
MLSVWKIFLVAVAGLALVAPALAQGDPVQQFSFQLQSVKPDGRFTLLFSSRTFDTTGGQPPLVTENYLRLPAGATLRKQFRNPRFYCDGEALLNALNSHTSFKRPFASRVANLDPLIAALKRQVEAKGRAGDRKALANAQVCKRSRIGSGTAQIDARPILDDLIPVKLFMFFAKSSAKGAVAAFTTIGIPDTTAKVVKDNPLVAGTHVALTSSFFDDPTPDGLYGYKLVLPAGKISGLPISVAELKVTTSGLSIPKGACLKAGRHGKCVKRQPNTIFWFTQPTCPPSGQIGFLDFYGYDPPLPDVTKTVSLACPKFG